jgi:hypothetical protein
MSITETTWELAGKFTNKNKLTEVVVIVIILTYLLDPWTRVFV